MLTNVNKNKNHGNSVYKNYLLNIYVIVGSKHKEKQHGQQN